MGIAGLLKALADVQRETHVSELAGLRVGLDAYCFLHRGKYRCAMDIVSGRTSGRFTGPALEAVQLLRAAGAEPVLVFDGGLLPAKRRTEEARHDARAAARWRAAVERQKGGAGAARLLAGGVEVTPEMAAICVREARALGVCCIVAPCEADAQLAHLAISGRIDICITEDADLLAFGCPRVLFGLDCSSGRAREIRLEHLARSRGLAPYRFTPHSLLDLCILAGCDYLPSLPGVGLRTAAQLLHRSGGDLGRALTLARRAGIPVPSEYAHQCAQAKLVFTSQVVFNTERGCLQNLRPLPAGAEIVPGYLGPEFADDVARSVAAAEIHPVTLKPFIIGHAEPSAISAPRCLETVPNSCTLAPLGDKLEHDMADKPSMFEALVSNQQYVVEEDVVNTEMPSSSGACTRGREEPWCSAIAEKAGAESLVITVSDEPAASDGLSDPMLHKQACSKAQVPVLEDRSTGAHEDILCSSFPPPRSSPTSQPGSAQGDFAEPCLVECTPEATDRRTHTASGIAAVSSSASRQFRPPRPRCSSDVSPAATTPCDPKRRQLGCRVACS